MHAENVSETYSNKAVAGRYCEQRQNTEMQPEQRRFGPGGKTVRHPVKHCKQSTNCAPFSALNAAAPQVWNPAYHESK